MVPRHLEHLSGCPAEVHDRSDRVHDVVGARAEKLRSEDLAGARVGDELERAVLDVHRDRPAGLGQPGLGGHDLVARGARCGSVHADHRQRWIEEHDLNVQALLDAVFPGRLGGTEARDPSLPVGDVQQQAVAVRVAGREHAWVRRAHVRSRGELDNFITGGPRANGFAPHLGVICGNFTPPDGDRPALLTHREVETTFHEFGHLLHHCTSKVEVPSRAGIHVAWDWVELPSQLMENWTWEREALDLFAKHHETGESFPEELFERVVAARRYMGGWAQMRQLSLGTVDLALHGELAPRLRGDPDNGGRPGLDTSQGEEVMRFGEACLAAFAPAPRFAELHMLTSFTHLFSGGYAAAYYSYLWSEVLDADVFTRFKREGIFNRDTGRSYVDAILSRGDSADPDELFIEFMGRAPDPEALLERNLGDLATA